ncbi:hypothetical protein EU538_02350 [Candidatus Thorarchaeota archaeon]|jgi:hypothetical protein|nr:MAG: hypothetical protein EU538_02350 [Candidatus Thorarchaeota archaeon]
MQWWMDLLFSGSGLLLILLIIVVLFVINGIFLGIALGFVNGRNRDLGDTFVTSLLIACVSWIPCLGCILSLYFIKSRHSTGWGGAIIAYILTGIIALLVILAITLLVFPGLFALIWSLIPIPPGP